MRVLMLPHLSMFRKEESGIRRVVEAYFRYLPHYDVDLVDVKETSYDLRAVHAGGTGPNCEVAHLHGMYFTEDYGGSPAWQYIVNANIVKAVRAARQVTVPSRWVAEIFQRDMRLNPNIIPHGIEWEEWQHGYENEGYILWNKNRNVDVCFVEPVGKLAKQFPQNKFVSTFPPLENLPNVKNLGLIDHRKMKTIIQKSGVYLSTTKETFGIGVLEAMASGVPVLGFDWGGNQDLIKHGVNGYLAQPNNYEDLAEGLNYCLEYRDKLGQNGRFMAKDWNWENACRLVAEVYQRAMKYQPAQVSVIIPTYNYADKVGTAIKSVLEQTYDYVAEIIVVDDGSTDQGATHEEVKKFEDPRIRYVRQENSGVSSARNRGISMATSKYICCLDADDRIEPRFLQVCVDALESDPSLSIAYTGLFYIKPNGDSGVSPWPAEFNFDHQLLKRNQIPTCCVYTKEMWERLGGYKKRYEGKGGAGAEDAEFWLRAGAYGFKAEKVTDDALFIYSWQSGRVSGNKEYREPPWLDWHPWAGKDGDKRHPLGSMATPAKYSHPVRQYDEPLISVIIPVGPGHEKEVENALDSLEAQTFRRWEAIVVDDTVSDTMNKWFAKWKDTFKAYPYIKLDVTTAKKGAGAARNLGVKHSRAPYLFFLDADDWLTPTALDDHINTLYSLENEAIIYSDYVGKAFLEDPSKLSPNLELITTLPSGESVVGYRAAKYDCERAQAQPLLDGKPPYLWCNVTSLIPRSWHDEIGGFDESMISWEDVDYHWRMARAGKCYVHIPKRLLTYRFYTGERREVGLQNAVDLLKYLSSKYERMENMPCSGCGGSRKTPSTIKLIQTQQESNIMSDDMFVEALFNDGNRGFHEVVGGHVFPQAIAGLNMRGDGNGYKIIYGQRRSGDRFLVHKADISAARPGTFTPIEAIAREVRVEAPRRTEVPPPPQPIKPPQEPPQEEPQESHDFFGAGIEVEDDPEEVKLYHDEAPQIEVAPFDLQTIPGVTPGIAYELQQMEVSSYRDIVNLGVDNLVKVRGIGDSRANMIYNAAVEKVKE